METLQLKLFVSLSRTYSFTKTANEFFVSQPTVSTHIKALERSLGVTLLDRDNRKVSLTQEGLEFVDYAQSMLNMQSEAVTRLQNISKGRRGYIRIAILSSMSKLFSECLSEFSRKHQGVQVDVFRMEGIEMIRAIRCREYDIYFGSHLVLPDKNNVEHLVTGAAQLQLFIHKRDIEGIDTDNLSTLRKVQFIAISEMNFALSGRIRSVCMKRGLTPEIMNYYNSTEMVLLAVNSGVGATILPQGIEHFYSFPNIVSLPIRGDDATVKSVVIWHNERLSTEVEAFLSLDALKKAIGRVSA